MQQIDFYIYGFALVVIVLFLISKLSKLALIKTAYKILPPIGLMYFVSLLLNYLIDFFKSYFSGVEYTQYAFLNRITGPYCVVYFFIFFKILVITQLFRIKKIIGLNWIVFLLSILLVVSVERIVIILTSFHRDYLPSSWTIATNDVIETIIYSLFLFLMITSFIHYRREIFRKVNNFLTFNLKL